MMELGWTALIQSSLGQALLAQASGGETALNGLALMLWFVVMVLVIAGVWKTFEKAGQPGWAVLIPIFNAYILLKVAGRPGWWLLLFLIPLVNLVIAIIVAIDIAAAFRKGVGFALGLVFLGPIFYMILGFGDAQYAGPPAR